MLAFQVVGIGLVLLFLGALVTGNPQQTSDR